MIAKVSKLPKASNTLSYWTSKGKLALVNHHVPLEVVRVAEAFPAARPLAGKHLLRVNPPVTLAVVLSRKLGPAARVVAKIGPLTRMDHPVRGQIRTGLIGAIATRPVAQIGAYLLVNLSNVRSKFVVLVALKVARLPLAVNWLFSSLTNQLVISVRR